MSDEIIIEKYEEINQLIEQLGKRLITKLAKYGVNKNNESFTDLIHSINEIKAAEKYYINNEKPQEPNLIPITYNNGKYECDKSLIQYNDSLIQKIIYYIKLLKYYLALKGIKLNDVNNTNTVAGLIELIDFIEAILPTTLTINDIEEEYYADEEIRIPFSLIDSENNVVQSGKIEIYDGDVLLSTIQAADNIYLNLKKGTHDIKIIYKGTDKYESSESSCTIIVKAGRIKIDTIIANQTETSLYYRSFNEGLINDKWYINIVTKDTKGNILPNIPLLIKDITYENDNISEIILSNNAITNNDGIFIIQNVNLNSYGEHTIIIETLAQLEDVSDNKKELPVNVVYDLYYTQHPNIIYYEGQTQPPMIIDLYDKEGNKPLNEENQYLYDGLEVSVTILNILNDEVVLSEKKIVQNGSIIIDNVLPIGYYHIMLDTILDLSIDYADIHFNIETYTIDDIDNLIINASNEIDDISMININTNINGIYNKHILKQLKIFGNVVDNENKNLINKPLQIYRYTNNGWELIKTINTDDNGKYSFTDYGVNSYIDNSEIGSRNELANLINTAIANGESVINLKKQYKFESGDTYITVPNNITINGNGHIIDANNKTRIFYVNGNNVTINDIILKNGNMGYGGAIYWNGNNGLLSNTVISDCISQYHGGGVYWEAEKANISNVKFINNATNGKGGGLYFENGEIYIDGFISFNNYSNDTGACMYIKGDDCTVLHVVIRKDTSNGSDPSILKADGDQVVIEHIDVDTVFFQQNRVDRTTKMSDGKFKYKVTPSPSWVSNYEDYATEKIYTPDVISNLQNYIDKNNENDIHKYHVYGLFTIDVRENLNLIKNATDDNGNIKLLTERILTAINNNDTDFIKSLTLSNDKIFAESIIKDDNKSVILNLEEAIGKIYLNDDKNIEYEIVSDIYSLDNRRLQYNKQQG